MKYIVFDLDGVLADCSHRLKYIQKTPKDYDKFYSKESILKDKKITSGAMLFNALDRITDIDYNEGLFEKVNLVFITGRNEISRDATIKWLSMNIPTESNYSLLMREKNDWRPAHQVKEDFIKKYIKFENILFAFDDDEKINEMYAKHEVMCYKPNITIKEYRK